MVARICLRRRFFVLAAISASTALGPPASMAQIREAATIAVTAEVVKPVGVMAAPVTDTTTTMLEPGVRQGHSARHRELVLWPGSGGDVLVYLMSCSGGVSTSRLIQRPGADRDVSEPTVLTVHSDSGIVVTLIPVDQ